MKVKRRVGERQEGVKKGGGRQLNRQGRFEEKGDWKQRKMRWRELEKKKRIHLYHGGK